MIEDSKNKPRNLFKKAEELKVVFEFEIDNSIDSTRRTEQVREIISQMLLLARKRGRPSTKEENYEEAA